MYALEEGRCDQDETDARLGQALVDFPHEWLAEDDVPLAEPDRHILGFEEVMQFSRGRSPVVPSVAKEQVVGLRAWSNGFDRPAVAVQRGDLARGVGDR